MTLDKVDTVALLRCGNTDGYGEMCLADTARSKKNDVFLRLHKTKGFEVLDLCLTVAEAVRRQ